MSDREQEQKPMGIFTIAFDPQQGRFSFVGNMPVEQALAILQQALAQQQRERMRQEILKELESKANQSEAPP
ncbi:MAG TPA: hypothetical protein G4O03_01675 [Dehalococcoidia bacterium]|nr:hypothetical protein [Dehalococcoidia bacterium]